MTTPERPRRPARRSTRQRTKGSASETTPIGKPSEQGATSSGAPVNGKPQKAKAAKAKADVPNNGLAAINAAPKQSVAVGSIPQSDSGAAVPAVETPSKPPVERDDRGRFVPGNNGGPGRPLGSRNKLVEDFIADFRDAWREGGKKALKHMADSEPAAFVRAAVQLMPKDVLVEARGAGLVVVKLADEDLAL
jgi:hypothetical protein